MYERIGEETLRQVIDTFVERVYADTMIGFFFAGFDKDRLKRHELQFAARALGGQVRYEGAPIQQAHSKHPIMGGQFNRRKTILAETLRDYGVDRDIVAHWLEHTEKLRPLITAQPGSDCLHDVSTAPLISGWSPPSKP